MSDGVILDKRKVIQFTEGFVGKKKTKLDPKDDPNSPFYEPSSIEKLKSYVKKKFSK